MSRYRRTDEEVADALREQREFLRRSCEAYDAGALSEAKRIATSIYVLCHDGTGRTKSLLHQLGLKERLLFASTARPLANSVFPKTALAGAMYLEGGMIFAPNYMCKKDPAATVVREVKFSTWWEETVFQTIGPPKGGKPFTIASTLSRKNLVFFMRSQDNGSHFDRHLRDDAYAAMAKWRTGFEFALEGTQDFQPVPIPHLATVRQIAWELEQTLDPIPGGPPLPPPDAVDAWLQDPPSQFRPGLGKRPTTVRLSPEMAVAVSQGQIPDPLELIPRDAD